MEHGGRTFPTLRKHRRLLGYSRKRAARLLSVDPSDLTRWEHGLVYPNLKNLIKLTIIYQTSVEKLYPRLHTGIAEDLAENQSVSKNSEAKNED